MDSADQFVWVKYGTGNEGEGRLVEETCRRSSMYYMWYDRCLQSSMWFPFLTNCVKN
jgi:hypothetical protein